jgi:hypothetical protein
MFSRIVLFESIRHPIDTFGPWIAWFFLALVAFWPLAVWGPSFHHGHFAWGHWWSWIAEDAWLVTLAAVILWGHNRRRHGDRTRWRSERIQISDRLTALVQKPAPEGRNQRT